MSIETSYTEARANLASLCDKVVDDCETVIIKRRGRPAVALIAADELASLRETVYLLSSPANGLRLLTAFKRAEERTVAPMTIAELKREVGLDTTE